MWLRRVLPGMCNGVFYRIFSILTDVTLTENKKILRVEIFSLILVVGFCNCPTCIYTLCDDKPESHKSVPIFLEEHDITKLHGTSHIHLVFTYKSRECRRLLSRAVRYFARISYDKFRVGISAVPYFSPITPISKIRNLIMQRHVVDRTIQRQNKHCSVSVSPIYFE